MYNLPASIQPLVPVMAATVVSAVLLLVLRAVVLRWVWKWVSATTTPVDDFLYKTLRPPSLLWALAMSLMIGVQTAPLPEDVSRVFTRILVVLLIVSVTLVCATLLSGALKMALARRTPELAVGSLGLYVVRGTVWCVGLLVVLNYLGIQISPLLTALGVGGLAMALALQDTLGNLFAGIHLLLEKPFVVGHYIQIDGIEGRVLDIGWRTTRMRTLQEHVLVIPNNKISTTSLQNFNLPDARARAIIEVGLDYNCDLEAVLVILRDELQRLALEDELFDKEAAPDVWVVGFGESAVNVLTRLRILHCDDLRAARDRMCRAIFARFKTESITIPFPQRVLWIRQGADLPPRR